MPDGALRSGLARARGAMLRGALRRSTDPFAARTWRRGGRGRRRRSVTPTRRRRGRRGPPRREPSPPAPRRPRPRVPIRSAWNCIRKRVRARAAVGAQHADLERKNVEHVRHLVGDRLERGAHEMRAGRAPRQTADQSAGLRIPLRRAQTRQRRDEEDAFRRGDPAGERLGLGRRRDHAEPVAQPLQRGAADEHGSLGGELGRRRRARRRQPSPARRSRRARDARRG